MKILLRDFQTDAVDKLVRQLRKAARDAKDGEAQAVSLSSPTGSGKTVMATAAIERILTGDDEHGPQTNATFLWLTDLPELNKQTRNKMLATSSALGSAQLVTIENDFDAETFAPGVVYFLNTQKLATGNRLVTAREERKWTIWETITNTVNINPGGFYVFIDEAHRGMGQTAQQRNQAVGLMQKFILGSAEIPPVPLIVGISATLARFEKLLGAANKTRGIRPKIDVLPADVRESGLIKETVLFWHPTETQASDMTMLRAGARRWQEFGERWTAHGKENPAEPVRPLLIVQVQDRSKAQGEKAVTQTDLGAAIAAIEEEVGQLPGDALAHAFQEGAAVEVAGRTIRHLPPSEISDDPNVRVVFFKSSLNTGWDCPRAEVMMSFRTAEDATAIAQLVGRMVRTPLARRVADDEYLNTVALFLPHYNERELKTVVERLSAADPENAPGFDVKSGADAADYSRAPGSERCFAALASLPTYTIPRVAKPSELKRIGKLARALAFDQLKQSAPDDAARLVIDAINEFHARAEGTSEFQDAMTERTTLDVRVVSHLLYEDMDEGTIESLPVSPENIGDIFEAAGRKLGEGVHKTWWRDRVNNSGQPPVRAKLELCALCLNGQLKKALEHAAQAQVRTWQTLYGPQIAALPEARRAVYEEIRGLASEPEEGLLTLPQSIEGVKPGTDKSQTWKKHLFADERGDFALIPGSSWETIVLQAETKRPETVGWLRNTDRKPWALKIPYPMGKDWKAMYPDFLVFREEAGRIVTDILEPHDPNRADALPKAKGLLEYVKQHDDKIGRVEYITVEDDMLCRLDMKSPDVQQAVETARSADDFQDILSKLGK